MKGHRDFIAMMGESSSGKKQPAGLLFQLDRMVSRDEKHITFLRRSRRPEIFFALSW
jgi:hypothetical protein